MNHHIAINNLRLRYIIGLSTIALLVSASWFTLQAVIAKQENFSILVDLAGHQTGHAERIAFFTMTMVTATDEETFDTARAQLGRIIIKLEQNHKTLLNGDDEWGVRKIMTPILKVIYFDANGLDIAVQRYLERARSVYETPYGKLTQNSGPYIFVTQYGPHVINRMFDAAAEEYSAVGKAEIRKIKQLETWLWVAALTTLFLEVLIIFRPMERRVREAFTILDKKNSDLEKTIVELVEAKTALSDSEEKFRAMADNVPGIIFQLVECRDGKRHYVYVSPQSSDLYGVTPNDLLSDWEALKFHPEDRDRFLRTIREAFENQSDWTFEGRVITPNGEEKWCRGISKPVPINDDEMVFNGLIVDITHQKMLEDKLRNLATTDPLTGALNRRHFYALATTEIKRVRRSRNSLSVLMFDLDHFKRINDTFGHSCGDQALKKTVTTIQSHLRPGDTLARFGGEEFCVMLPDTNIKGASALGERIRQEVANLQMHWKGETVNFTTSAGVTEWMEEDESIDTLLERADCALYLAKSSGRNTVRQYLDVQNKSDMLVTRA